MKRKIHKTVGNQTLRECSACKCWKTFDQFYKHINHGDGLYSQCKICQKERSNEWRKKNRHKINLWWKKNYKKDPEKHRQHSRKWYHNNPEKRSTLKGRIDINVSNAIRLALKGRKNGRSWEGLVGYSCDQLIRRLKRTMPQGYTFNDYLNGKLHLDHIIPISVFNYNSAECIDFKKCWSLKNLRLIPADLNLKKGNKLDKPFQPSLLLEIK